MPDDHVSVVANGSRIGEIDLEATPTIFMASKNVFKRAEELGYWDPKSGQPFRFYDAYSPESRTEFAVTRREWRVLDLLAPSLQLHPNANHFPFSVKPEKPVTPERIMEIFRDTFEGTEFDVIKDLTIVDDAGKTVKSPMANPFMPYDMNKMLRTNGGWSWRGERCLARWFCMYATVTQSRGWLPEPVGGVVWLGYANPAMTTYVPIYAGVTDLPEDLQDRRADDRLQPSLGVVGVSRRWPRLPPIAGATCAMTWPPSVTRSKDSLSTSKKRFATRPTTYSSKTRPRPAPSSPKRLPPPAGKRPKPIGISAEQLWNKYDELW